MTIIVGHKGAAGYAPENTIKSFETAIEIGCDRVELDILLTKDNEIIVSHDKDVSKLTNGVGLVSEMTLSDLKKLEYDGGDKIPTLQEVIDICKDKIDLQIELKSDGISTLINDLIIKNNIEDNVVITSFKIHRLKEIKNLNPRLDVGLLFWTDEVMEDIWNLANNVPLDFFGPFSEIITKEFIDKAHNIGKYVYAYRVNTLELGNRLISMGVDAIGTDFPKLFIKK